MARIIPPRQNRVNRVGRHYKPFKAKRPEKTLQFQPPRPEKNAKFPEISAESVKSG
jgi:hypothetical protein